MQKIKFIVVREGKIAMRGEAVSLPVLRKWTAKFGGSVISLDSKQAV